MRSAQGTASKVALPRSASNNKTLSGRRPCVRRLPGADGSAPAAPELLLLNCNVLSPVQIQ